MRKYIIRRLLLTLPTLFILTLIIFMTVHFIPGDVIDGILADWQLVDRVVIDREALERKLGLDKPVVIQYAIWLRDILFKGTLGTSLFGGWEVEDKIIERLPVTLQLGAMALIIGLVISLPVGIYSAVRQDTATDYVGRTIAIMGLATPNFWLAMMVIMFPAIWWDWTPPITLVGFFEDPIANLYLFAIPSAILGTAMAASTMRLTRTMMLEVLRQDYIRTASSKGLKERVVVVRHAIRNAMIPVVTLIGMELPIMVGGSVIIENIFALPGVGRLMLEAFELRDFPVIAGGNLFFATIIVMTNLLIDLVYPLIDPRVRLG